MIVLKFFIGIKMSYSYMQAIAIGFPDVQCHSFGNEKLYENIIWESGPSLPSKDVLDIWILSNTEILEDNIRKITVLAFRNRFSKMEKIKIEMASIDNPSLAIDDPTRLMAAALRVDLKDTDNATFIDLDNTSTREGVLTLEQYDIIDPGRALIILDSVILPNEKLT